MVRQLLRRSALYISALALVVAVVVWDTGRRPQAQVTAKLYIGAVRAYEAALGPLLAASVTCRFRPTCSEYSVEAVRRFGIRQGLVLTARRVLSCRPGVRPGTYDPVPPPATPGG